MCYSGDILRTTRKLKHHGMGPTQAMQESMEIEGGPASVLHEKHDQGERCLIHTHTQYLPCRRCLLAVLVLLCFFIWGWGQ